MSKYQQMVCPAWIGGHSCGTSDEIFKNRCPWWYPWLIPNIALAWRQKPDRMGGRDVGRNIQSFGWEGFGRELRALLMIHWQHRIDDFIMTGTGDHNILWVVVLGCLSSIAHRSVAYRSVAHRWVAHRSTRSRNPGCKISQCDGGITAKVEEAQSSV